MAYLVLRGRTSQLAVMLADYDLVILGGGCAGLSVATRLVQLGSPSRLRTLILESRTEYLNDRTWCFWGDAPAGMRHLIRHRWQTMKIGMPGRMAVADCGSTPYQMLPAGAFYAQARRVLAQSESIDLLLNAAVIAEPHRSGEAWRVETSWGTVLGRMVIDTRPCHTASNDPSVLWQSFYGHEIECAASVFDPSCAVLMDFSVIDSGRILFTYVLPVAPDHALVEATVFGPEPLDRAGLANELADAIQQRVRGAAFTILRSESGILPMGPVPHATRTKGTYIQAGLTAGGVRPGTGYAFQRIQKWAETCAQQLGAGGPPVGHAADPWPMRAMDQIFLAVLRARPDLAPALFVTLFEKVDTARLIRFLSDRGTPADLAMVVSALPSSPFLRQLPAAFRSGYRGPKDASAA